ncbi:MAG: hypothetical protein V4671_05025 [Armatimonadota bacterium]
MVTNAVRCFAPVGALLLFCAGVANAQTPPPPPQDEDHGRPVALVARDLGVTPEQFRAAFRKVRPARPGEQPPEAQRVANRKVLSESLGVSPEKLDAVMDKYRPGGRTDNHDSRQRTPGDRPPPPRGPRSGPDEDHGRPVELVARELGVTPAQFREAFRKVHPAGPGQEPTHAQRVANRKILSESLGVSPERLDAVMDKYRPGGRGTNGPRRP